MPKVSPFCIKLSAEEARELSRRAAKYTLPYFEVQRAKMILMVLRSKVADWSDEKLWKAYIQLTQAEAAFRIQKDQLAIRPLWHQREDRVQAHILVCFLAFVLWKTLELWQQGAGLGNSRRTLLEELARIQAHDVILPTNTHGEVRLRCVTQPDAAHAALLDRLGIVLRKRIRVPQIAADSTERAAA